MASQVMSFEGLGVKHKPHPITNFKQTSELVPSLLRLRTFTLLAFLLVFPCQPQHRKYQKTDARADRAGVVRPRGAQEPRIPIVPRRDNRHRRGLPKRRPATAAIVEHEFEHAVSVGNAECGAVQARGSVHGDERGTDVWVEHRELELEVVQPGVGRPSALVVVPGDARLVDLWSG